MTLKSRTPFYIVPSSTSIVEIQRLPISTKVFCLRQPTALRAFHSPATRKSLCIPCASSIFLDLFDGTLSLTFSQLTMWVHNVVPWTLTFILTLSLTLAQTTNTGWASSATTDDGCTLTHVMNQPAQTPPVSTVWDVIMTTIFYAVDCRACTVTNANNYTYIEGAFTERTTSPTLMITRVACFPQESAITRDVDLTTTSAPGLAGVLDARPAVSEPLLVEDSLESSEKKLLRRTSLDAAATFLVESAMDFSKYIPPDFLRLPGQAQSLLISTWSAIFALTIADSGLNTTSACAQVQTLEVRYRMSQSWLDPDQVTSLLCFFARYGYNFNTTRAELYSTLQAAIYAIQIAGDFTSNRTEVCESLGLFYRVGGPLGIDTTRFQDYACSNLPSNTPTVSNVYGETPVVPLIPYPTNGTTSWGHPTSWEPRTTIWPTQSSTPDSLTPKFPNSTIWGTGSQSSNSAGTAYSSTNSTVVQPTGTGYSSPTWTSSGTASTGTGSRYGLINSTQSTPSSGPGSSTGNVNSTQPTTAGTGTGVWSKTVNITSVLPTAATSTTNTTVSSLPTDPAVGNSSTFSLSTVVSSSNNVTSSLGTASSSTTVIGVPSDSGATTTSETETVLTSATEAAPKDTNIHLPPKPEAKAFYPAVEVPHPRRGSWFKRY
ncbi:hypothetical protein, variant 1 [Exophiala mesophila]|nr:hypothetical protein, variant 1 [Exophiala mesophila]KIV90246.1 hypothetical protein, variant 1 [Exophiala mesophila]